MFFSVYSREGTGEQSSSQHPHHLNVSARFAQSHIGSAQPSHKIR